MNEAINEYRNEVRISIGDETYVARPTLHKMAQIEAIYGGVLPLSQRFKSLDFQFTEVIGILQIALSDTKDAPDKKTIAEKVFDDGVLNYLAPATEFLAKMINPGSAGDAPVNPPKVAK